MTDQERQVAELLLQRGLLKAEQMSSIEAKIQQSGHSLDEVLRTERLVFPEALAQVKAEVLQVPYIDLSTVQPNGNAMRDISRQAAATYRFVAFEEKNSKLLVAMESPDDFQALEAIKFIAKKRGLSPEIYVASKEAIDTLLGGAAEVQVAIGGALRDFSQELATTQVAGKDERGIAQLVEDAPVTKVVAVIIRHAIEGSASDIHIEPTARDLRVRYRIDGDLFTSLLLPLKIHPAVISRVKILANMKIDEARLPQDGRFSSRMAERSFDFRVSSMPTVYGEKVALRILDKSQGAPSFDDLGLWGPPQRLFVEHLRAPHGIILISGPTGAGKSTTLFSSLSLINDPDVNISTLEDPVEYEIPGVNQTQINPDIGLTFASGLRNLLRQDPDVLMVGEIRDKDTAALAVHASLTGHLVLSTIHTNDAIGSVPRLVDMGVDPFLLTASLRLLVAQRLVTQLCPDCKREEEIPAALKKRLEGELEGVGEAHRTEPNQLSPHVLYAADGCPKCHETGAVGRLAIFEVVPITRDLRSAINSEAGYDTLQDIARQHGAITMRQDGLLKALAGYVHYEDVIRVTSEAEA